MTYEVPEKVREEIRLLITNASLDCTEGGDYQICRPIFEDETKLADQICAILSAQVEEAKRQEREDILKSAEIQVPSFRESDGKISQRYLTVKITEEEYQALKGESHE